MLKYCTEFFTKYCLTSYHQRADLHWSYSLTQTHSKYQLKERPAASRRLLCSLPNRIHSLYLKTFADCYTQTLVHQRIVDGTKNASYYSEQEPCYNRFAVYWTEKGRVKAVTLRKNYFALHYKNTAADCPHIRIRE